MGGISILNVRKMVLASLFAALIAICAWISIPVPPLVFTLQTFGILLTLGLLGGKWGTVTILVYLLTGIVGLPVFAGFRGGAAALLDATGGFLWGFLLGGIAFWLLERLGKIPAMTAFLLISYACGTWWFSRYAGDVGISAAVLTCVVPYLIPDALKLALAYTLSIKIGRYIR